MSRGIKVTAKKGTIADVGSTINLETTFGKLPQEVTNFNLDNVNSGKISRLYASGGYISTLDPKQWGCTKLVIAKFLMSLGADHDLICAGHKSIRELYNAIVGNAYTDANFSENDLLKRFIIIANVDMAMKEIERIMKIYNHTSLVNPVVGRYMITKMGLNYGVLSTEAEQVPAKFLDLIRTRNQLVLPVGIKAFDEMMSLVKSVYADDLHEKSALVLFQPEGYYLELGTDSNSGLDCIKYTPRPGLFSSSAGVIYAIDRLKALCEQLLNDVSYQLDIAPKLNRAYIEPNGLRLGPVYYWDESESKSLLSDSEDLEVVFDEDVLYMIRNASFVGTPGTLASSGYAYCSPIIYEKTILSASYGTVSALVQGIIHEPNLADKDGVVVTRQGINMHSTTAGICTLFPTGNNTEVSVDAGEFPATGEKLQKCVSYLAFGESIALTYTLNTTDYTATRVTFSGPIMFTTFNMFYISDDGNGNTVEYSAVLCQINKTNSTDSAPGFLTTSDTTKTAIALEGLTIKPHSFLADSSSLTLSPFRWGDLDNMLSIPFKYVKTAYYDYLYQAFKVNYAKIN